MGRGGGEAGHAEAGRRGPSASPPPQAQKVYLSTDPLATTHREKEHTHTDTHKKNKIKRKKAIK